MIAEDFLPEWELTADGERCETETSVVLPVLTGERRETVLKLTEPGTKAEHEALALQHWHGRGAVTLIRANPRRGALLLERLGSDLTEEWDVRACEQVGALYRDLHIAAPAQLPLLSERSAEVAERLAGLPRGVPLPPRMIDQARALARSFSRDEQTDGRLVHTDLHYGTVLLDADGSPRAIAPKPLNGDPHHEVAPLLLHRYDELAGRVREGIRDRFFATIDAAELEERRAQSWVVVRMLDLAARRILAPSSDAESDRALITACVSIAKAVQD